MGTVNAYMHVGTTDAEATRGNCVFSVRGGVDVSDVKKSRCMFENQCVCVCVSQKQNERESLYECIGIQWSWNWYSCVCVLH